MDTFGARFFVFGGAVGAFLVGVLYLVRGDPRGRASPVRGILTSAYAPSSAVIFTIALLTAPFWRGLGRDAWLFAQLPTAALLLVWLVGYPGPRTRHLRLVPVGLFCWYWPVVIGTLFIYGK